MPTIKRILGDDKSKQGDEAVGYVEGNFIRCYEHSAYLMAQKHGLKPSKRAFKNVGVQVVSVGFPFASREKYLPNAVTVDEGVWRGRVEVTPAVGFDEWKDSLPLPAEQRDGAPSVPTVEKLSAVSGLPVYRACYNLTLYVMQWSINVPRDTRYTLAEDLKRRLVETMLCIYRANKREAGDRLPQVVTAQQSLEESLLYLRLLYDMHQIALAQYAHTAELASEVEKQLSNWRRSLERKGIGQDRSAAEPHP